jgi:hypothetical protein
MHKGELPDLKRERWQHMRYASSPKPVLSKFAKRNGFAGMHQSRIRYPTIKIERARSAEVGYLRRLTICGGLPSVLASGNTRVESAS